MTVSAPSFLTIEHAFKHKTLTVHPLSDVHIGAKRHHAALLKEKIAAIRRAGDDHRVLLLGDLADMQIPTSKHFEPGNTTADEELKMLVEVFKPIAERVDVIIPGNHEDRLGRLGLDYTAQFAALIERPQVYRPLPTVVRYCFDYYHDKREAAKNAQTYVNKAEIFVHHGYGGGRMEGNQLNKVKALALQKPDCHVYLMGHVHQMANTYDEVPLGWPPKKRRRLYAITGTYLDSEAYAIKQNFPPGATGSPVVVLSGSHHGAWKDVVASLKVG